ncbi:MAG: hypothetical protein FI705_10900 [SAR202 cluster bacterium]|nr:hypothetical protein [SAR202 cluster bacterium]
MARHTTIDYMVKTFRDQESERAFQRLGPLGIGAGVQRTAQRKLAILDAADCQENLHCSPRNRLARITRSGEKQGGQRFVANVSIRWWLRFRWDNGDVYYVGISNYWLGVAA